MGYEKFVKKVFPFIGKQYRTDEELKTIAGTITISVDELAALPDNKVAVFNFETSSLDIIDVSDEDLNKLNGKLALSLMDSEAEYLINHVMLIYVEDMNKSLLYFIGLEDAATIHETPFPMSTISGEGETITFEANLVGVDSITVDIIDSKNAVLGYTATR